MASHARLIRLIFLACALFFFLLAFGFLGIVDNYLVGFLGLSIEDYNYNILIAVIAYTYLLLAGLIAYLFCLALYLITKSEKFVQIMDFLNEFRERFLDLKNLEYCTFKLLLALALLALFIIFLQFFEITPNLTFLSAACLLLVFSLLPDKPPASFRFFKRK